MSNKPEPFEDDTRRQITTELVYRLASRHLSTRQLIDLIDMLEQELFNRVTPTSDSANDTVVSERPQFEQLSHNRPRDMTSAPNARRCP